MTEELNSVLGKDLTFHFQAIVGNHASDRINVRKENSSILETTDMVKASGSIRAMKKPDNDFQIDLINIKFNDTYSEVLSFSKNFGSGTINYLISFKDVKFHTDT